MSPDALLAAPPEWPGAGEGVAIWHSALTPHPHWVCLGLPEATSVGRAILHFADPQGRPVEFEGQASLDGTTWMTLLTRDADPGGPRLEVEFPPMELKWFRLLIHRSASQRWPNAAQLTEIELLDGR